MIPLVLKLKKQKHKNIAIAQDIIIKELYNIFDKAVLHDGTAIWRCYSGNRFSEDIDIYIPKDLKKIEILFENLKKNDFIIEKKKISENSLFSNLKLDRTIVKFEALFKKSKSILSEYRTSEGNLIMIYTLAPKELVREKVEAYLKRFKIRDLYDIFFLLRYIDNKCEVFKSLNKLVQHFKKPVDEKELRILIIEGLIPTTEKIREYIQRNLKWGSKSI